MCELGRGPAARPTKEARTGGRRLAAVRLDPHPIASESLMFVLALSVQLHLPECRSLKSKRAELRPIIEGARRRFAVAVAEVGAQDLWQRAEVGVSTVGSSEHRAVEVIDEVERFVWSFPTVEVLASERHWLEVDRP